MEEKSIMFVTLYKKHFRLILSVAILSFGLTALSGCARLQALLKELPKPTAEIKGVKFHDLSFTDLTLLFDVEIKNPYSVPLPLVNLGYNLATGEKSFLQGKAELQGAVPSSGSRVVSLPVTINFMELLGAIKKVKPGMVVPYTASLDLGVKTPGFGPMTLPLKKTGELPVPAVPKVKLEGIEWKSLSLNEASANVRFYVGNTNDFPINVSKLNYALSLAGAHVADTGISKELSLEKGAGRTVDMPIRFSPAKFGFAIFNLLRGEEAKYSIDGAMEFKTRFGDLKMPLKREGTALFLKKK